MVFSKGLENNSINNNQTVNDGVAHSKNPRKCAYHVTFDLDLEHILDAGSPGDHRAQVSWRSGHLPVRRSDLRKILQTDGRTDGRTDGQTTDAAPLHWNELTNVRVFVLTTMIIVRLEHQKRRTMTRIFHDDICWPNSW